MRKIITTIVIPILLSTVLIGCNGDTLKEIFGNISLEGEKYTKVDTVDDIMAYLLQKIEENSAKPLRTSTMALHDYEIVPITENEYINSDDIVEGVWLRPVKAEADENPRMILLAKTYDLTPSTNILGSYNKQLSKQHGQFMDTGVKNGYLLESNKIVQHSVYAIYVTWDNAEEIVDVFENHIQ